MSSPATLWLLLRMAARQGGNRIRTLGKRGGSPATVWSMALLGALFTCLMLGFLFYVGGRAGGSAEAEQRGELAVSPYLRERLDDYILVRAQADQAQRNAAISPDPVRAGRFAADAQAQAQAELRHLQRDLDSEAREFARRRGGDPSVWKQRLDQLIAAGDYQRVVVDPADAPGPRAATSWRLIAVYLLCWWLALVLQGEGTAFDVHRRRHPLWEWYLAFPVRQPLIYLAEALRPLASNPFLLVSPVAFMLLAALVNASALAGLAAAAIAVPFSISAAVCAKLVEVLVMLRVAPRNRSAWLVVAASIGFLLLFVPVIAQSVGMINWKLACWLAGPGSWMPSAASLVELPDAQAWLAAVALSLLLNALVCALALLGMHAATLRGFETGFGRLDHAGPGTRADPARASRWQRWPLLHKELLWLRRDRGALVQMLLVPALLVGLQFLNFGNLLRNMELDWHRWAGLVIALGAQMIATSAPRMLATEGPALGWVLCWPRSLLDLARTKALVLTAVVSVMVYASLCVLAWMYPADAWKLALVGLLWLPTGLATAAKAVTVFPSFSPAGEPLPIQASRQMATGVGNMVLAIALFTANWPLAVAGLFMNGVFAAALWERFDTQLAYLFDPDSEPSPQPPTMVSALVAIVAHLEVTTLLAAVLAGISQSSMGGTPLLIASALSGSLVAFYVWRWNRRFGVGLVDLLAPRGLRTSTWSWSAAALGLAGVLGALALGYLWMLLQFGPVDLAEQIRAGRSGLGAGKLLLSFAIATVVIAPLVEEFLFRGLLFRAMERQWSFAAAALVSAAFFAAMHPAPSWPPVFLLGLASAWLFARAGNLLPSLLLHAFYNAIVVLAPVFGR